MAGRRPHGRERGAGRRSIGRRSFPWGAFVGFMTASLASGAGCAGCGARRAASPTERELVAGGAAPVAPRSRELVDLTQAAGAVRPDVTAEDVRSALRAAAGRSVNDEQREVTLRRRYLELVSAGAASAGRRAPSGPAADRRGALGAAMTPVEHAIRACMPRRISTLDACSMRRRGRSRGVQSS